jgi:hypothetical protein
MREPRDYRFEIGSVGADTSTAVTMEGNLIPAQPVNFQVKDLATGVRIPFAFIELDGNDGRFTAGVWSDYVFLLKRISVDSLAFTWTVWMGSDSLGNPAIGDTLALRFFKPFLNADSFRFTAITGPPLGVRTERPFRFSLSQNYPNPFNPQTEIRFSLGSMEKVDLEIYDILGRKVRTLVHDQRNAGEYVVRWEGRNDSGLAVSSGVYFYRLNTGTFVQVKKMLLLR